MIQYGPIYANFDLSERELLKLIDESRRREEDQEVAEGAYREIPVELARTNDEGFPFAGNLDYVDQDIDPETGKYLICAVFSNPKP